MRCLLICLIVVCLSIVGCASFWSDATGPVNKRGWNELSGVWGKRVPNNDLSSVWGSSKRGDWDNALLKRDGGWNNLKGLWGKRDNNNNNWNNLKGLWGKRSNVADDDNNAQTDYIPK